MGEDANREAAERCFRAFERWNLDTVASVVAEEGYFAYPFEPAEWRVPCEEKSDTEPRR